MESTKQLALGVIVAVVIVTHFTMMHRLKRKLVELETLMKNEKGLEVAQNIV
ncbi:hypothetical protein A2U01_0082984, partial [Trifolium medium]|nr:hypothetical protein [Trifolium medium]